MRKNTEADFWSRVDKTSDPQGCWLWTGNIKNDGYGFMKWSGKAITAHRLAYLLSGHTIPEGLCLAHSEHCIGKRHCCNPAHLTPKTTRENALDMHRDGTMICKLSPEQVLDIRSRVGQTQRAMAEEFGVDYTTIYKIIHNKRWSHL